MTLYKRNKNNSIQEWSIATEDRGSHAVYEVTFGQLNGRLQCKETVVWGKNIGKSSETTPYEQAEREAYALIVKQREAGYCDTPKEAMNHISLLPMLAKNFRDYSHKISYPCMVQPKLDGVRCIINRSKDHVQFLSRKGKEFTPVMENHKELLKALHKLPLELDTLDGEFYVHGWHFQEIVRAVKKYREDTLQLQYHCFDLCNKELLMHRIEEMQRVIPCEGAVLRVSSIFTPTEDEVNDFLTINSQAGYEGVIIRNLNSCYEYGTRSYNLQKWKNFVTDEYEIIGATFEDNNLGNAIMYECTTKEDKPFRVRPKGNIKERVNKWNRSEYSIGKLLTVRYQNLSEDGIPIFPIGLGVRDYE